MHELLPTCSVTDFAEFVGRGRKSTYCKLDANAVDGLQACGCVNPIPFVPDALRATITTPSLMFPNGVKAAGLRATVAKDERWEYLRLLVRHLRAGKVRLCLRAAANAPVFAVHKSGSKPRETWNGHVIFACCGASKVATVGISVCASALGDYRKRPVLVGKERWHLFL